MARILMVTLLVAVVAFLVVQAHAAYGKPSLKTIANIVVHAHHHAPIRIR
jgi:hypothetical protein